IWVYIQRRSFEEGRSFVVFSSSIAIITATLFDLYTTHYLTHFWYFALVIVGAAALNMVLVFPQKIQELERFSYIVWLGYLPAWGLFFYTLPTLYNTIEAFDYVSRWRIAYLFSGISTLLFLGGVIYRRYASSSPVVRQQSRSILWGTIFSFGPVFVWILLQIPENGALFTPLLFIPLGIFPLVVGYTILRYRALRGDYILQQGILYTLLVVLIGGGYAAVVGGLSVLLGGSLSPNNPLLVGGLVLILALLLNPLRQRLRKLLEVAFFRSGQAYQDHLQDFSRDLTEAIKLQDIVALLRKYITQSLSPHPLHIYVYDQVREDYGACLNEEAKNTTDIRFLAGGALARTLSQQKVYLYIQSPEQCPTALQADQARLALTGAQLFVPIRGQKELVLGWLALGARRSGEPYNEQVIDFLEKLSDQAALALERAQVVGNLERRVDEMNIFARIAQGVNITLNFDDVLELIYAQTVRLISAQDFFIALYDERRDSFSYAFYLENDMRLLAHENVPIEQETLAQLVARQGVAIITNDYEQECHSQGIFSAIEGVYAWMGVPLNVGDKTIGSLNLGSRDLSIVYTESQRDLLQAIADQTSGAITKARLLRETQRRARQLSTLNDLARSLTSTLELNPLLLQILESAAAILDAEAGTLFLLDEDTRELIFEVVIGPAAEELIGTRLPPGTGHVGQAADTGKASIVTNVHLTEDWAQEPDKETGFQTRDLLIAPMELKGDIIGVIELINKHDGTAFNRGDQELLTSFSSQAAIAIENARLYTQTDQALAARVEELSTMQEIDRELNASLEVERAMQITLEQALNQVGADAGFAGIVHEESIRVMAQHGYDGELEKYRWEGIPFELPYLQSATRAGVLQQNIVPEEGGLLTDSKCYLTIPIRRESDVIGVLMLERKQDTPWLEDSLAFLSRLSNHAAIAIANAQLYTEVQEANHAKSEFVSFVSHELKTPMTSIQGYSDLLLKGAVGEINEAQENFLRTIHNNVGNMRRLVSDLADISRIESGHLDLNFVVIDMYVTIDNVIRSIQSQIEEKEQKLSVEIPEDIPLVWGDQIRLVQILTNLVSNAHKYTSSEGEIFVRGEQTKNQWDTEGVDEVVHIAVQDKGMGIPEKDQPNIFSKFFRTDEAKSSEAPGTGLGLSITRDLVEMQGGKIWFESVHNQGTTFHFTIPIAETD
ncbi:MAG: GAF domain-containing protein, partial [Chloroflexota bacterium]|nr:GAF domain-containing protein [Chloroflexota bacterium]